MSEAIFGLIGVVLGGALTWFKDWRSDHAARERNARYLAIHIFCILDKYVYDCVKVVEDDGHYHGQPRPDGTLEPQVKTPPPPTYPDDVDWKSIDHRLMYRLLSLPGEAESADLSIDFMADIAGPPFYEEFFEARQFQYSNLGLRALNLKEEIRETYGIPPEEKSEWSARDIFTKKIREIEER